MLFVEMTPARLVYIFLSRLLELSGVRLIMQYRFHKKPPVLIKPLQVGTGVPWPVFLPAKHTY